MADTRKTANKGNHFLRNQKCDTLKIVTDQNIYLTTNIEENNNAILEKYNNFTLAQINIPLAVKSGVENNDNSKISQASSSTATPDNSNKGAQVSQEFVPAAQKKPGKKLPMIKVPDLFKNVKIKKSNYLKYNRVNLDKFGPPVTEGTIVPNHYVKYIDACNPESQNTEEKNWTYDKKLYEITETSIENLKKHKIDISPSDCEWVIDCFEKTAINDKQQSKKFLIQEFRRRILLQDVQMRVSNEAMEQIYDHCWKTQREQRANRSFIRLFWWYQDKVGDDNFATFAQQTQKTRPCIRLKIQAQVNNYCNCFIERESSANLCFELQAMNQKIYQEIDVWRLEDAQFDMLIGKEPQDTRFKFMNSKQPITELSILQNQQMQIPFKTKSDQPEIIEKMNSLSLQEMFMQSDRYLHFVVQDQRFPPMVEQNILRTQQAQQEQFRQNNQNVVPADKKNPQPKHKKPLVQPPPKPNPRLRNADQTTAASTIEDNSIPMKIDNQTQPQNQIRNNPKYKDKTLEEQKQEPIQTDKKPQRNKIVEKIDGDQRKKNKDKVVKPLKDDVLQNQELDQKDKDKLNNQVQSEQSENIAENITSSKVHDQKMQLNQPPKKAPKIKRKKFQSIGRELIWLISMIKHQQEDVMGLKIHPEAMKKEKVDITNTQRINGLQNFNFQFNREQLDKLKNTHLSHLAEQATERQIEMKKKYRTIEQETLICSYQSTDQYQFDFMPKKEQPFDEFEKQYLQSSSNIESLDKGKKNNKQVLLLKKQCLKQKKQIKKIQESYEALKSRQFRVRRGRNNRILYKSQMKTVFDFDLQDNQDFTHDVMDDLLIKINERENQKKDKERKGETRFHKKIDKLLMDQKVLADDLEKYCYNKRLKKNAYKMDMLHNAQNTQKSLLDSRPGSDPIINNLYKRIHAPAYQQLMNHEADKQLLSSGVQLDKVYENQGTTELKLQTYNDLYAVNNDKVSFQSGIKDQQEIQKAISNSDKQDLLRNIKFIKEEQAYLFESQKNDKPRHSDMFQYGNLSMQDFKANLLRDFNSFKRNVAYQQENYLLRQEQATGMAQTIE